MGFVKKILRPVLKVAAAVASVAALIPGPHQPFAAAIAVAATVGSSLLQKKPKAPETPREGLDRLQANIDPRTPRKFVFGNTAMATDIRDYEYSDNQEYLHQFIVVAAHKVQGIDQIWMNEKLAWTASGGAQGEFVGYLTVTPILEGNAGNAINIGPRMGTTRRYTGCAYVHIRYKLTGNSKKTESPFASSVPTKMVIKGRGAFVYDPRLDSTVPGGSGSHRADDQSTWAWSDNGSRNPALQMLWYMLGWRINGKLSVGCGISKDRIDMESFITAANLCDEPVTLAAGGTEPRYRSNGVGSTGINPIGFLDNLKAAMNADLDDVDGKLRVTVFHNDLSTPVADFGDDDMIDGFTWNQTPDLSDMFNVVRGSYVDSSDKALYQMVDYPEVRLASRDGIERVDQFDLAFVESPSQAQRLAKQRLQRQQYGGTFETVLNARGWLVEKNSVVRVSLSVLGWTNKLFRVAQMEHRVDGTCPIVLREENADIYAWDEDESPAVEPADPTEYDYKLNPFYQGIEDASTPAWSDIVDEGGKPEDNADVTASSTPRQEGPSSDIFTADYEGQLDEGQLPRNYLFRRFRGATDVSAIDTTWSIISQEGITDENVTVDGGAVTIPDGATIAPSSAIVVQSARAGEPSLTSQIAITRNDGNPPSPPGGNIATVTTFSSFSTQTWAPVTGVIAIKTGPNGDISLTAPLKVKVTSAAPAGDFPIEIKWMIRPVSGSFVDVGTAAAASPNPSTTYEPPKYYAIPGAVTCNRQAGSLTPNADYEVQMYARKTSLPDRPVFLSQTASVIGS